MVTFLNAFAVIANGHVIAFKDQNFLLNDIAVEFERFLGPNGYADIQVNAQKSLLLPFKSEFRVLIKKVPFSLFNFERYHQ